MNAATFSVSALRVPGRYFYVWMALGFVLVAFGGFVPTYWAKVATGTFQGAPILHLHGALMFTWVLFYFAQTLLVATGRTLDHRQWGLAGIALFTLLLCSILAGQLSVLKHADLAGVGDAARRFAAVTLCGWTFIAALFAVAIANVRRPEVHKRLMVVMLAGMMTPAIARVFLTVVMGGAGGGAPPPPFVSIPPALVADLFIVVAVVRDWRLLGRPHPAYIYAGTALLAQQVLTVLFARTTTWMSIAAAFERFAA